MAACDFEEEHDINIPNFARSQEQAKVSPKHSTQCTYNTSDGCQSSCIDKMELQNTIERSYFINNGNRKEFGCKHYARNCFVFAECCQKFFVCRLCHNEFYEQLMDSNLFASNSTNNNNVEERSHQMDRYATKTVKCMNCGKIQPFSKYCINPNCRQTNNDNFSNNNNENESKIDTKGTKLKFGEYCCDICKFLDNVTIYEPRKEIFHCDKCNMCRIGLKKDFTHCNKCDICIHNDYYATHRCIENSLHCDCPLCMNYLFTSVKPVTFWKHCGHAMHKSCMDKCLVVDSRCPICRTNYWNDNEMNEMIESIQEQQQEQQQYHNTEEMNQEEMDSNDDID